MFQIYILSLITFVIVDFLWLGIVAKSFYRKEIGPLMLKEFKFLPALIFYLIYPIALMILVIIPASVISYSAVYTIIASAVLGIISYSTYNLTNMAVLKGWSWKIVMIDTIWGAFLTTITGIVGITVFNSVF